MKNNQSIFLILLVLFTHTSLCAQDTITIHFNAEYQVINKESYSFMELMDNHNDEVIYFGEKYEITFPEHFNVSDTAVGLSYFTGWENQKIKNHTAFLFGNYTSKSPIVYVDYNHNLDFTDDGQPLKFDLDSTLTVFLESSDVPSAYFPIRFFYHEIAPEEKEDLITLYNSMLSRYDGNTIVDIDYWLASQRKNSKIVDTWLNGKAVKIGLYDYDCNGLFNDQGKDRIMIGNFEEDAISINLAEEAFKFSKNVQIPIDGKVYEVVYIESTGKYIQLVPSNKPYVHRTRVGDYIGDIEIELLDGEVTSLQEIQKEDTYLLLDFWGTWCKGCTQQLPILQDIVKSTDQIQVLGLNSRDDHAKIEAYLKKHKVTWTNGLATEALLKKLRVDNYPNYMLIDKKGKILMLNARLNEIENLLNED